MSGMSKANVKKKDESNVIVPQLKFPLQNIQRRHQYGASKWLIEEIICIYGLMKGT